MTYVKSQVTPQLRDNLEARLDYIEDGVATVANGGLVTPLAGMAYDKWQAVYANITYGRAMLSMQWADCVTGDYATLYPLLLARNLVTGLGVVSDFLDTGGHYTTAQALEMQNRGMEIMCHSKTHSYPANYAAFQAETTGAQAALVAKKLNADSWVQPGWGFGTDGGAYYFDSAAKLNTQAGELLRENFASAAAYASDIDPLPFNNAKPAPPRVRYGYIQLTITSGYTLAQLKIIVDSIVNWGGYCNMGGHFADIGVGGNLTLVDLTSLLDYIQAYQDAGKLDVLTPTAALYATKFPTKVSMSDDSDFTLSVSTTATGVNALNSATVNVGSTTGFPAASASVPGTFIMGGVATTYTGLTATSFTGCSNHAATTGGEVVASYVFWVAEQGTPPLTPTGGALSGGTVQTNGTNYVIQRRAAETSRSLRFIGYGKSVGATTQGRVLLKEYDNTGAQVGTTTSVAFPGITNAAATKCVATFGLRSDTRFYQFTTTENGVAADVLWSNVTWNKG